MSKIEINIIIFLMSIVVGSMMSSTSQLINIHHDLWEIGNRLSQSQTYSIPTMTLTNIFDKQSQITKGFFWKDDMPTSESMTGTNEMLIPQ